MNNNTEQQLQDFYNDESDLHLSSEDLDHFSLQPTEV
jgi:hypothetical protein